MEGRPLALLMLSLSLLVEEVSGDCFNDTHITVCPFPVFLDDRIDNRVEIGCRLVTVTSFKTMQLGIVNKTAFYAAAESFSSGSPALAKPSMVWYGMANIPEGSLKVIGTAIFFTLVLQAATVRDLAHTWTCRVLGAQITQQSKTIETLAHPGHISLDALPVRATYSKTEKVTLRCTANKAVVTNPKELSTFTFQYKQHNRWLDVNLSSLNDIVSLFFSQPVIRGDFISYTESIKIRASIIPGCSRRYRCFTHYKKKYVFDENAAERVVSLATDQCTRLTNQSGPGNVTEPPPTPASNITTTATPTTSDDKDVQASAGLAQSFLLGTVITGALLLLAVTALITIAVRRRQKKKLKKAAQGVQGIDVVPAPAAGSAQPAVHSAAGDLMSAASTTQASTSVSESSGVLRDSSLTNASTSVTGIDVDLSTSQSTGAILLPPAS
ncbi:hypothetical protein ACOMHN_005957 [Nucella lapillus]